MENKDKPTIINENHMENCNVFQGDIYGATFPLPGAQVTINQYYGKDKKQKEETQGNVETAEDRDKRKKEVVDDITSRFDFATDMMGYDDMGQRITNDRLACLFRKCLGVGSHPGERYRIILEQVWVLLIDERNQCVKVPGEKFFRQTVLNIIGYFCSRGIIAGKPHELASCVFRDADPNKAKNIARGVDSNVFPDGLKDMLDYYIDEMKNGKF